MGWLLFWIVLAGLPILLGMGFLCEQYLRQAGATSHEDGA